MELVLAVVLGVGMAAASGLRAFVPLLVASLAARAGHLTLAPGFEWIGGDAAIVMLGVACVAEVAAAHVPWLDHALDVVGAPVAVGAGTLLTAAFVTDMSPMLRWTLALLAGGGAAGAVHGGMALVRAASTALTGGLGNPVVAAAETGMSLGVAVTAVVAPVLGLALVVGGALVVSRRLRRTAVAAGLLVGGIGASSPALACSIAGPQPFEVDASQSDQTAPDEPELVSVEVTRGVGPTASGCGTFQSTSCDDLGFLTVELAQPGDDEVGYRLSVVELSPQPEAGERPWFEAPEGAIRGPSFTFTWIDEATNDQEAIRLVLEVVPVDAGGDEGPPLTVEVTDPGGTAGAAGCETLPRSMAWLALVLAPLGLRRRRPTRT